MYQKSYQVINYYAKNGGLRRPMDIYELTALSGYYKNNKQIYGPI